MDKVLEEQIERMRQLNERLAQMHRGVTETNRLIARDRETQRRGPLHDVRDYRTHESHDYGTAEEPTRPHARPRATAADSSRKRRRR
jgi:hypothetical protein